MSKITPCLWFDRNAEDAARLYTSIFPGGKILSVSRYGDGMPLPAGTALTVEIELAGQRFTALNGGPVYSMNPSISFFVHVDTEGEASRLYGALAEGGRPLMPLAAYPWSPSYAWVQDRFGASWQVITGRRPPSGATIVPCFMFAGAQHGKAAAAMEQYTRILGGSIDSVERYAPGEGPEGTVKHGRFVAGGQELVAMDSHVAHGFTFNEGISLQLDCDDQAELDRYWAALTDGGTESRCGWMKDRFGVSWQVVPRRIAEWMTQGEPAARARTFQALLGMTKLDIATLERAHRGEG